MSWDRQTVIDALLEEIRQQLLDEPIDLQADDDLLGSGLLDSLGVMRLIRFVEQRFAVTVPPIDVTIENFMTVGTIATYLESLRSEDGSTGG